MVGRSPDGSRTVVPPGLNRIVAFRYVGLTPGLYHFAVLRLCKLSVDANRPFQILYLNSYF